MNINKTIGEIVADDFRAAEIFKSAGIDFCCGGNKSFQQACDEANIAQEELQGKLDELAGAPLVAGTNFKDWDADFLCDYIVNTHHKLELDWLEQLKFYTKKIAEVHGEKHPELIEIKAVYNTIYEELVPHFQKEEKVLFPAIKETIRTETNQYKPIILGAISQMHVEHEVAGGLIDKINNLSNGYKTPEDACNTFLVAYKLLEQLENDIHIHIHLENNVLFPKVVALVEK